MSFVTGITIINIFLIVLITLVFLLYLHFKRSFTYWSRRGVITPPCSFPLGNLNDVALGRVSFQEMFKEFYSNLKPKGIKYAGYYLLQQPVLVLFDIELIKSILIRDFAHFTDHGLFDKKDYDTFGGHIFSLKGADWKKMREKLTPLFTSRKLKLMFPTIQQCCDPLANLIDQASGNNKKLNIKDIASRYTSDVIASIAFGIESNTLKNPTSDFLKYGQRAAGTSDTMGKFCLAVQFLMPKLATIFKIPIFPVDVSKFFLEIVQSTVKYREDNNIVRKDFMQLMIQLKNNIDVSDNNEDCFNLEVTDNTNRNIKTESDLSSISIEQIVAQSMLFFIAGYDTSSTTLAYCMYELAFHQDIQERLRDEIITVINKHDGKLCYNAIMEMTYMEKCIRETLRKHPIFPDLFRGCTKTYQVPNSDLIIEKGMIVLIPINDIQYDPEYYPNPEIFDPERFSSENISTRNTFTWLPFGEGPRLCIGARLAIIKMKVALATLLKDFRYRLDSKTVYPLKRACRTFLTAPEEKIWLNVEKIIK